MLSPVGFVLTDTVFGRSIFHPLGELLRSQDVSRDNHRAYIQYIIQSDPMYPLPLSHGAFHQLILHAAHCLCIL